MQSDSGLQSLALRAIAVSSSPSSSMTDRQSAFQVLQDLQIYQGRLGVALSWLGQGEFHYERQDITVETKLLALEIVAQFLEREYLNASEVDRVSLRHSLIRSSHLLANTSMDDNGSRVLARKIAAILEGLVVRDFPQRWSAFASDVFTPMQSGGAGGGLWYEGTSPHWGIVICLECLKLVAEDCTDSDFNAKISTKRRNDVLIGLNEVSDSFLPLVYNLLERAFQELQSAKSTLHNIHQFLVNQNRTIHSLSTEERDQYNAFSSQRRTMGLLLSDALTTIEKFCASMPVAWMLEKHDFLAALMHLLRERQLQVQIRAVECIEMLCLRGKLELAPWMRLVRELPVSIRQSQEVFAAEQSFRSSEAVAAGTAASGTEENALELQVDFHRSLSRLLSTVLSSHLAHITTNKHVKSMKGPDYESVKGFLQLMVEILQHPSGRICSEQVNTWVALLRDPQIVKTRLLDPFLQQVMVCYIEHLVRLRWEDVENKVHLHSQVLEASFDDEDDYDSWMADLRSKSSLLFKLIGNVVPDIATNVLNSRLQTLLTSHGMGQPMKYLDASNEQLTQKSDAVIQFEGFVHPLDNTLGGIPSWAMEPSDKSFSRPTKDPDRPKIRETTVASLSALSKSLVSWTPSYLWLKFRRASLLESMKYYWKHDPSTLLSGVESLLGYLGLPDEWRLATQASDSGHLSAEIVSLKKKSGVTLVAISKHVPQHLVPWLAPLSGATRALLSNEGVVPTNQMHLYEFLSCVASAVQDPMVRANFVSDVLSNAVAALESTDFVQHFGSATNLLATFGAMSATVGSVTDHANVNLVASHYNRIFSSLNRLLSVGRRCNEASRKRGFPEGSSRTSQGSLDLSLNFVDEGPVSLQELAIVDPFVPLWPRILPSLLQIYEAVLSVWRPEFQAQLLPDRLKRYVFAISDDEAFLAKPQDHKTGGVFGEGGSAGSVVSGTDRRRKNLVPKWSGWLNELRNTCFQMFGLLASQRALYAPEIAHLYPRLVAVITDPLNLRSMEHRHIIQFLKHVLEMLLVSCPTTLYATHLAPLVDPIFEHLRFRLDKTWLPILNSTGSTTAIVSSKALTSSGCHEAADRALKGGDEWFEWYYGHAGLFVGDLDEITSEAVVEKYRVEISRTYSDVLQVAFALKGDWALVLANFAKEDHATKRNDPSRLSLGPVNQFNDEGLELNADGTPKAEDQALIDERKLQRIDGLCHFLLLENEPIAGNLTLTTIQCLGYPDAYTCRRVTKLCHRILETVAHVPQYSQLLGQHMLMQAVKNVVTEPKWMVGMEWDILNVVRDIYCRLVLGQSLQSGGQGAGQQQVQSTKNAIEYDQSKTVDRPLQGGGILTTASEFPRHVLLSLPGISLSIVEEFEHNMKQKRSSKDQKDLIRDVLRQAADAYRLQTPSGDHAMNLFARATEQESLLHLNRRSVNVPDLTEKLVTHSQVMKAAARQEGLSDPAGLSAFHL